MRIMRYYVIDLPCYGSEKALRPASDLAASPASEKEFRRDRGSSVSMKSEKSWPAKGFKRSEGEAS